MKTLDEPIKVSAVLRVEVTGEFYDEEVSESDLCYFIEQGLEDAGWDVNVSVLKEDPNPCSTCQQYSCDGCDKKSYRFLKQQP